MGNSIFYQSESDDDMVENVGYGAVVFFKDFVAFVQALAMSFLCHAANQIAGYITVYILGGFRFFCSTDYPVNVGTQLILKVVRFSNIAFYVYCLMAYVHAVAERFPIKS